MYTKCVLTVALTIIDADFPFCLKKVNGIIQGTMYAKCVLTVPLTIVDADFPLSLKKVLGIIQGTMYTKCTNHSSYYNSCRFSLQPEKSSWCYPRNDVYKMCIDRSSYYSRY